MRKALAALAGCLVMLTGCAQATVSVTPAENSPTNIKTIAPTPAASGSGSATPASTTSGSASLPAGGITLTVSGSLLWQEQLWLGAKLDAGTSGKEFDFAPTLSPIKPIVSGADLSVCQQDVPFAPNGGPYKGFPTYSVPPLIASALAETGFEACTTGSDHANDAGYGGITRTLDTFRAVGIKTTGTFASAADRRRPLILNARGVKVAVVSATATTGSALAKGRDYSVAMLDANDLIARAKAARQAGAQIVLAAMHAGDDTVSLPTEQQKTVAAKLANSPYIDLVYGFGAQVVQPWEQINGKWVAYGLGNLAAQPARSQPAGFEGVIARFTFTPRVEGGYQVSKAEYIPTLTTNYSPGAAPRVLPILASLNAGVGDQWRLKAAVERTRKAVHELGAQGLFES